MKAILLVPLLLLQAEPPPKPKAKIDCALSLVEAEGAYAFVVEGSTDLPREAVLRARVYTVMVINDFQGTREDDDEPLVWEDDPDSPQPGWRDFDVGDGKFRVEVYRFARKPWAIPYRAKVHYLPKLQTEQVRLTAGDEEHYGRADLRYGTPAEYAAQLKTRGQEALEDIVAVERLFRGLEKKFAEQQKKRDAAEWKAWKEGWYAEVEKIAARNRERYGWWAVWMERQAKMRVGGMCEMLRQLLVDCGDVLEGRRERPLTPDRFEGFVAYHEEAIDVLGVSVPLPPERVGPPIAAYEKGFAAVRAWVERGEGDWPAVRAAARRDCMAALLEIPPIIKNRKRAHEYVDGVTTAFAQVLRLADEKAPAAELRKALEGHDRALAEFKEFAGLK